MAIEALQTESGEDLLTESGEVIALESSTITTTLSGNAGFKWTPPGTSTENTLQLRYPLKIEARHANVKRRSAKTSLDFSVRDVAVAAGDADEFEALARFTDRPQRLLEMLRDGREVQVDYYEDLSDSTTKHQTWVMGGPNYELEPEQERAQPEWRIRIRLRGKGDDEFDDLMT